ncbi:cytochrome b [Sinorhizobium alkalisoli]|uniref:Cytochrome B n=1 Tax=Sinorhizobium alkalisoli TaxID=1752398 RepID=A0A1E3VEF0_9HYPH|nr:cytochrome b [Sinorhizobium alkalisoli]MCA1492865.1 cytochrome b [Ensifer sp. NBAIM29]MCG5477955.1 cytochrome b [Sinorhizobium alkalisoli]ODR91915.1 cytochrome B [Sinorhizobium alkalisoli]QFI66085.1 cytochrome B561 [Sinorhizobium alkalisoli]
MLRNSEDGFGAITIILHWTLAALILGLMLIGILMRRIEIEPSLQFSLYQWHKSFGFTTMGLAILRAAWWFVERHPQPVASLGPLERTASRLMHRALIAIGLLVPLAGWAVASASTLDIPSFYFNLVAIPHLPLPKSDAEEAFWTFAHAALAYVMLGLIAAHAAAALFHHIVRRDAVLTRMLHSSVDASDRAIEAADDETVVRR